MSETLMFWRAGPQLRLSPAEIARELTWGEDVDGLIDLPIKEIIGRLKAEFSQNRETPGLLTIHTESCHCEATWTWQHVRVECHGIAPAERERLRAILAEFGCAAHEE
jgi:hypothetical protein